MTDRVEAIGQHVKEERRMHSCGESVIVFQQPGRRCASPSSGTLGVAWKRGNVARRGSCLNLEVVQPRSAHVVWCWQRTPKIRRGFAVPRFGPLRGVVVPGARIEIAEFLVLHLVE